MALLLCRAEQGQEDINSQAPQIPHNLIPLQGFSSSLEDRQGSWRKGLLEVTAETALESGFSVSNAVLGAHSSMSGSAVTIMNPSLSLATCWL